MKISDLRNLINEYRNVMNQLNRDIDNIPNRIELKEKAHALKLKINKVVKDKSIDKYLIVNEDLFSEYFSKSDKILFFIITTECISIFKNDGYKRYCTDGLGKSEINLYCLVNCIDGSAWGELFYDYPGLEDYLWNLVENNIKAKMKKKLTLIQRKIKQNNKELEFYNDSEKIEKKIKDLTTGKESLEKKKKAIETAIKEI